ncbi:unnamed protein product [Schistosoma margrebowiei]|uniref:Uncharacterized protein n=1 Tax=Schistosoma margrebowiei TaxID=48269 RepID=A0A183M6G5_9TREM|nr:unnamed protein product [Schistosoma margrebowiei]
MVVGGSRQETMDPGFMLLGTRQVYLLHLSSSYLQPLKHIVPSSDMGTHYTPMLKLETFKLQLTIYWTNYSLLGN